ncbi:hypothetical protein ABZX72_29360 [Streptomyces cyaneofuscatus]|uniref:hypothetical protein n=1 Tax=Streptomyces cyaneofuscatus TaxID=66883 RepID=UPI0033B3A4E6
MELAELEGALRRLLPTEPPATTGTPEEVAAAAARWEVWQQVALVLDVDLPYVVPLDEEPVPYELTEQGHVLAASSRLRHLLAPSGSRP